jgi:hypothetical protein
MAAALILGIPLLLPALFLLAIATLGSTVQGSAGRRRRVRFDGPQPVVPRQPYVMR